MRAITEQILDEITAAIVRAVAPEHIYLFGSHARGDATSDSGRLTVVSDRDGYPGL